MKIRCYMEETVYYQLEIEVSDDASEDDIEAAAEETFCQGHYTEIGQDDRRFQDWERIDEPE